MPQRCVPLLLFFVLWKAAVLGSTSAFAFTPVMSASVAAAASDSGVKAMVALDNKKVLMKVAVSGATGRTGKWVVQELLERNISVVALVRDMEKAKETLPQQSDTLKVIQCDLGSEDSIRSAVDGCDAAIWCATGFSDAPNASPLEKIKRLLNIAVTPKKRSIDAIGLPVLGTMFAKKESESESQEETNKLPKVVMLSSAGVTRTQWDETKKGMFPGSADIPIVRLNPFGILDIKADSEEKLRQSGVNYCIVRPTGLNDEWPAGSRPVFSQGDIAVGRINRKDVAKVLVNVLTNKAAVGKTFEVTGVAGYPPSNEITPALSRLKMDKEGPVSNEALAAYYSIMQQLLPGEKQDAAALAMGQTYEQLDRNEEGRLGKRGEENAEVAAPKPTS